MRSRTPFVPSEVYENDPTPAPKRFAIVFIVIAVVLSYSCWGSKRLTQKYEYDGEGRLVSTVAPDGTTTLYQYDDKGFLIAIKYSDSSVRYGYDAHGNRIWMKDRVGATEYYYDAFDRLNGMIWKYGPSRLIIYDYDPWGYLIFTAVYNFGALKEDPAYKDLASAFENDPSESSGDWETRQVKFNEAAARLIQTSTGSKPGSLEYEVRYDHDMLGNLTSVSTSEGSVTYSYEPDKGQIHRRLPNGIASIFTYSPDGLLKSLRHVGKAGQPIAEYQYEYDTAERITGVRETTPEWSKAIAYTWDDRGYLKELYLPDGDRVKYDYDVMGNRTSKEDASGAVRYEYDEFGRLVKAGNTRYRWNTNGSLIYRSEGKDEARIKYASSGLPSLVKVRDAAIDFDWDGDGNLVSRRKGDDIRHYLPNPLAPPGSCLGEMDAAGRMTASYLYADVLLAQRNGDGRLQYFLEDGFNSIRLVADLDGRIIGRRDYSPFAEPDNMSGDVELNFRSAGERLLPDLSLYAIGGRLYDPRSARYLMPAETGVSSERFDSFNKYAHGCAAAGVFAQPRCNQTRRRYGFWDALNRGAFLGTRFGEDAVDYWARKRVETGNPLYAVPGVFAALWTPETWKQTTLTLALPVTGKAIAEAATIKGLLAGSKNEPFHLDLLGKYVHYGINKWGPHIGFGMGSKASLHLYQQHINIGGRRGIDVAVDWSLLGAGLYDLFNNHSLRSLGSKRGWERSGFWLKETEGDRDRYFKGPDSPGGGGGGTGGGGPFETGSPFLDPFKTAEAQLGGVKLAATAEFLGDTGSITGAVFDPERQCIVLVGEKERSVSGVKAEDLAVALMLVFGPYPQEAQFTLDPYDPKNPEGPWLKAIYIPDQIINSTDFGKTLYEADWLLKQYAFGVVVEEAGSSPAKSQAYRPQGQPFLAWANFRMRERRSSVPEFRSTAELTFEDKAREETPARWSRFWILVDDFDDDPEHNMTLKEDGNTIHFATARMRVEAMRQVPDPSSPSGLKDVVEGQDPVAMKFKTLFTDLYDKIALETPVFGRVRDLAKAVALAKWIKKKQIDIDLDWVSEYAGKRVATVEKVNALGARWQTESRTPYSNAFQSGIQVSIRQVKLFGGIDLTVKPKYISDDGTARSLREAVISHLSQQAAEPVFTVEHQGKRLQATVLPLTRTGQELWKQSPTAESDGVVYRFNDRGEIARSINSDGNATDYLYDSNGKIQTIKATNSASGNVVGQRKADGAVWTVRSPRGDVFEFSYGNSGFLKEILVNGQPWASYEIDSRARKVTVRYKGYTQTTIYDALGNVLRHEIVKAAGGPPPPPDAETLDYGRDGLGNLTAISRNGVRMFNASYADDGTGPVRVSSPLAEILYVYDARGRIKQIKYSYGLVGSFEYDDDDEKPERVRIDYQGRQAEAVFDENGITESKDLLGNTTNYEYRDGRLSSIKANQVESKYDYDPQSRLSGARLPDGSRTRFEYKQEKPTASERAGKIGISSKQVVTVTRFGSRA